MNMLADVVSVLKIISLILTVVFSVLLIVIGVMLRKILTAEVKRELAEIPGELHPPAEARARQDVQWATIRNRANLFTESEWKLAVIEADKFVDAALIQAGFHGETMGERLMLIQPGQLLSLQELWDAHKLRNLLVHDPSYQMTHRQAVVAVQAYEKVLKELGVIND